MAENKTYYWLKLRESFFNDKEIKKLRKIAGGDTYTIIYLKLMLLSLRETGNLYFEGIEDTFAEELALELDEDVENVKVTLLYLQKMGLIQEVTESELFLTRMPECVGKETNKAELMRKKRAKEKLRGNNVTPMLPDVTKCYPEIEKEKEIEIELEKEQEKEPEPRVQRKEINYQQIADMYNEICISLPRLKLLSDARKKAIKARFNNGFTVDTFRELFTMAEQSSFLKGKNEKNWNATFDWLLKDANAVKVLDGNYIDRTSNNKTNNNGFVEINGKQYISKNGKYYLPNGSGVAVNPFATDDLPF